MVNGRPNIVVGQAKTATSPALQTNFGPPGSDDDCRQMFPCSIQQIIDLASCLIKDCLPGNKPKKDGEPPKLEHPKPDNPVIQDASKGRETGTQQAPNTSKGALDVDQGPVIQTAPKLSTRDPACKDCVGLDRDRWCSTKTQQGKPVVCLGGQPIPVVQESLWGKLLRGLTNYWGWMTPASQ